MSVDWEAPGVEVPGSPSSYGRRLRARHGGVMAGLDPHIVLLLEKLFEIPWLVSADDTDAAQADQPAPLRVQI
jgi:hypothetical protein